MKRIDLIRTFATAILISAAALSIAAQPGSNSGNGDLATQLFNKATEQYNARQYDAAIANYTEYLKLRPNSSAAYFNRGLSLYNKAQLAPAEPLYRQAAADFSKAIELKPNDAGYWTSRASVYIRLMTIDYERSLAQALSDLNQAIKLDPKSAAAYRERGVVYELSNQYSKALPDLNTAIRLDPKDAVAYYTRAKVHGGSNRYAAAKADAEMAIKLFPNYEAAQIYRNYMNEQIAKAAAAKAQPKPSPVAKTPVRTWPAPNSTPRSAPLTPEQQAAAVNDAAEAFKRADDAEKRKDHRAVIAYTTRYLQLSPLNQKPGTMEDLMRSFYLSALQYRARSHSVLKNFAASDADYENAVKAAMDITNLHLAASNEILQKDAKSTIAALMNSDFEMEKAMSVCRRSVEIADEWRITANAAQAAGMAGVRAGILLMGAREICVPVHISRANALAAGRPFQSAAQKADDLKKAIEILTTAINFANSYPRLYEQRAKLYRAAGRNDLAAADEAKVRELSAPKKN